MDKQELQILIFELRFGNVQQRRAAAYKLGKSNNSGAVPILTHAYNDDDSTVQKNAIDALRKINSQEALDFLSSHNIQWTQELHTNPKTPISFHQLFYIAIYIVSTLLTGFVFSVVTTMLIVFGIEQTGGDPGAPIIMLIGMMFYSGIFSVVTAIAMTIAKAKYNKEFSAKFSALIFLFTYIPFHIIGFYFSDEQLGFLAAPLAILTMIMLFFSYMPFFHMTAQGFINLYEFVKRQELAGNRYVKFIVLAFLGAIVLFVGWLIFKPETQPSTGVLSLQDNWQLLEAGGQDWQRDAYLQDVVFYPNSRLPYEISATYLSKSAPEEIYSIDINKQGKISNKETSETYPMRESAKLPIKRDDWKIGSVQAWNMFTQIESVNSCVKPPENNAFFYMVLHRIGSGKLAWELSISGCSTMEDDSSYYLDAKTGETIGSYFE